MEILNFYKSAWLVPIMRVVVVANGQPATLQIIVALRVHA